VLVVLTAAFAVIGCPNAGASGDGGGSNGGNGNGGSFEIGDMSAAPAKLYVTKALEDGATGARIYLLSLTSSSVDANQFGFTGSGDAISIKLLSPEEDLASQKYTFGSDSGDLAGLVVYTDYDFSGTDPDNEHPITGGEVDVSVTGSTYDITFDLQTASGPIAGSFSGSADGEFDISSL
jgi:hypothetical protein